jgi:hypothetical protein
MRPGKLLERTGPGRPRKYGRPSRAVTVTLPEDVLVRLRAMDGDVGRAIVALVERRTNGHVPTVQPAEIASYGNHAVIVVTPVRALRRIPGVQLVPIGNGRALISLEQSRSIPQFELDILDAIAMPAMLPAERDVLQAIADILRRARGVRTIDVEERTIIVLQSRRSRRAL